MTVGMIILMELYLILLLIVIDFIVYLVKAIGRREASQRTFRAVLPAGPVGSNDKTELLN